MTAQRKTAPARAARNGYDNSHSTADAPHSMLERQVREIACGYTSLDDVERETLRLVAIYGRDAVIDALRVVGAELQAAEASGDGK